MLSDTYNIRELLWYYNYRVAVHDSYNADKQFVTVITVFFQRLNKKKLYINVTFTPQ